MVMIVHAISHWRGPREGDLIYEVLQIGWIGVDLFFVLSGFLITRQLVAEPDRFGWFYVKRIARIFPLYYAVLAGLCALNLLPLPDLFSRVAADVWENVWVYALFLANFARYLGVDAAERVLGQSWSLAVEEQFYLLWPFAFALLGPARLRVAIPMIIVALAVARFVIVGEVGYWFIYVFPLTHADGLLVGSLIALHEDRARRSGRIAAPAFLLLCGVVVAIMILGADTHIRSEVVQKVGFLAIALMFGAFVVVLLQQGRIASLIDNPPLVLLGRYSYAIYLLHIPVLVVANQVPVPEGIGWWTAAFAVYTAVMLGIGWLSWTLLEAPAARVIRSVYLSRAGASRLTPA